MELNEVQFHQGQLPIDGYGPDFFRVAGAIHDGPLLLTETGIKPWLGADDVDAVIAAADEFDLLLVGVGADIVTLPKKLRTALRDAGIAAEYMATPSAARTYNVLLSEGRRVAAALLVV